MQNELNLGALGTERLTAADRLASKTGAQPTLLKHARISERVIQSILFFCGVLSIFTTVGIILVLGNESLRLFTTTAWLDANNELVEPLSAEQNVLHLSEGGQEFTAGHLIQIKGEIMRITEVIDRDSLLVERGVEGTQAVDHAVNDVVLAGINANLGEFLTGTRWAPPLGKFGILPLLNSTIVTTVMAMLVAIPVGLGAAIYLSEYASERTRGILKPILEILAGIPTVVYGYFALTFMTPLLRVVFGNDTVPVYNVASAGLVMGFMIVPTISSMSEDALSAVPRSLREASYGLGATRLETVFKVLLPAALSGIIAAFILAISRAVGETMIVAIAAGAAPANELFINPFVAAETMTGHIARISTGDLSFGSIDYNSVFAIGLALFLFTLVLNLISGAITRRFREVYA